MWPSGLRRWPQAPVRKGVGSNPTAVNELLSRPGQYLGRFMHASSSAFVSRTRASVYIAKKAVVTNSVALGSEQMSSLMLALCAFAGKAEEEKCANDAHSVAQGRNSVTPVNLRARDRLRPPGRVTCDCRQVATPHPHSYPLCGVYFYICIS